MEDFVEIEPGGFKIEFTPHANGGCVVSMEPSSLTGPLVPNRFVRTVGVVVSNDGTVLEMDSIYDSPFLRTYATYLVSDREGLFGRICPSCKSYFRTNCLKKKKLICPYCSFKDDHGAFTTDNQKRFMSMCCRASFEAMMKRVRTTFDTGEAIKALPNNRPTWVYTEKNQQHTFSCGNCREYNVNIVFNILGEYGNCPSCGKRNYRLVFNQKINSLADRFKKSVAEIKDARRQEEEWKDLLGRCVSLFDSIANDMSEQLLRLPATPKRKKELGRMSFQNIRSANDRFKEWYAFEILAGFSEDEAGFIHIMFNRRHLVTHNECRVDQKYLDDTKDTTVALNQTIRIQSQEINRLIELIRRATNNLIDGYDSIQ